MSSEDVASFQNELMRLADFSLPSVTEICNHMRMAFAEITEEITSFSSVPRHILADYFKCIETAQRFRAEEFNGACPLEALVFSSREFLGAIMSWIPSGRNSGIEIPAVEGDTESRPVFLYQKAWHARTIFDEIVFGSRPCHARQSCVLPIRSACAGLTGDLTLRRDRCPRESLIGDVIRGWQVNGFVED
jgi:hypothetical protein